MPDPALIVLAVAAGVGVLLAGLMAYERRRLAARDEALARLAVQRGWRYQALREGGARIERFQGTGLAGAWTLDMVDARRRKRAPRRMIRWSDGGEAFTAPPADVTVVFLIPTGGLTRPFELLASGGMAGAIAGTLIRKNLAQIFVHAFGDAGLSGRELQMVKPSVPLIDYAVFAERKAEADRRVTPGLASAIQRAFSGDVWRTRGIEPPWITLAGDRVALAFMARRTPDAAAMTAVIDAGTVLASVRD
jgi:hypothetical protein